MTTVLLDLTILGSTSRVQGIGRYVGALARGLHRLAISTAAETHSGSVRVVGIERLSWLASAELSEDLEASLQRLSGQQAMLSHPAWAYRQRFSSGRAARLAAADLLHTGHSEATPLGLICPRVTTCHDLIPLRFAEQYLTWRDGWAPGKRRLDQRRYDSADHIIAVSQATADELVGQLGVCSNKITVVHNGIDMARWLAQRQPDDRSRRQRYGLDEGQPYLLYVGAADWRKNAVGMLAALARARRHPRGRHVKLIWAGKLLGQRLQNVRCAARALGLEAALELVGYVPDEDLGALYRGAVAKLFLSRAEGFGYPVVEAMAAGCPVISSDCSSTAEVAGEASYAVDPEDHKAAATAIVELVSDPGMRQQLREAGLARARKFTLERMAEQTLAVYRQLT